jgi:hypothetical protein
LLPNPKARLKDQFHEVARFKHLSPRTETAYWEWVVRHLKFHKERAGDWRHPRDLGSSGVTPFVSGEAFSIQSVSSGQSSSSTDPVGGGVGLPDNRACADAGWPLMSFWLRP